MIGSLILLIDYLIDWLISQGGTGSPRPGERRDQESGNREVEADSGGSAAVRGGKKQTTGANQVLLSSWKY